MKKLFLCFALSAIAATSVHAQKTLAKTCGIYYDYDAAGNRIRRMYDCHDPAEPIGTDPETFSSRGDGMNKRAPTAGPHKEPFTDNRAGEASQNYVSLFPNPTSGKYTLKRSKIPEKPMHFYWYTDQMQIISSGTITSETYSGDISAWADATYILRVYSEAEAYTFKVVKSAALGNN